MSRPEVNTNKYMEVKKLNEGDIVLLTSGKKCIFERCKQKNFIGNIDGTRYNIFINNFDKLLGKSENDMVNNRKTINNKELEIRKLHTGDKIKLNDGKIAEFVKINRTRFTGLINGESYSIPFCNFVSLATNEEIANQPKVQRKKHEHSIWCECENREELSEYAEYVEHYKGVNHGWICPECKKFVQIG